MERSGIRRAYDIIILNFGIRLNDVIIFAVFSVYSVAKILLFFLGAFASLREKNKPGTQGGAVCLTPRSLTSPDYEAGRYRCL
jgi:hypothetical protein